MTHIWYHHPPIILRQNDKGWAGRVVSLLEYRAGEGGKWLLNPPPTPTTTLCWTIYLLLGVRMVTPGYKFLSGVVGWGGKVILVEFQTVVWRLSPLNIFFLTLFLVILTILYYVLQYYTDAAVYDFLWGHSLVWVASSWDRTQEHSVRFPPERAASRSGNQDSRVEHSLIILIIAVAAICGTRPP